MSIAILVIFIAAYVYEYFKYLDKGIMSFMKSHCNMHIQ